jgi:hypothetical protein
MLGHAVMGEQGVQEGAEYATLRGPRVEDQRSGGVVSYVHHLGVAHQEVQDPVEQLYQTSCSDRLPDVKGGREQIVAGVCRVLDDAA